MSSAVQPDQTSIEAMVEFIRTQLDADERNARIMDDRQMDSGWEVDSSFPPGHTIVPHVGRIHEIEAAEHIVRFGPDRVLAEVEAKRFLLEWAIAGIDRGGLSPVMGYNILAGLALSYRHQPGYDQMWRPA